jgi:hypothetical protein
MWSRRHAKEEGGILRGGIGAQESKGSIAAADIY